MRFLSLFVDEMRDTFVNEFLPYWKKVMDEVFGMDKEDMDDLFGQALLKPKEEEPKTLAKRIVLDKETVEKIRMALVADDTATNLDAKEDNAVGTATAFVDGTYVMLIVKTRKD